MRTKGLVGATFASAEHLTYYCYAWSDAVCELLSGILVQQYHSVPNFLFQVW